MKIFACVLMVLIGCLYVDSEPGPRPDPTSMIDTDDCCHLLVLGEDAVQKCLDGHAGPKCQVLDCGGLLEFWSSPCHSR
jgi:hypothetical protein